MIWSWAGVGNLDGSGVRRGSGVSEEDWGVVGDEAESHLSVDGSL